MAEMSLIRKLRLTAKGGWIGLGFGFFQNACGIAADRIETLYEAIAHGDDIHRAWLKQAIEDHFAGRPVQPPKP